MLVQRAVIVVLVCFLAAVSSGAAFAEAKPYPVPEWLSKGYMPVFNINDTDGQLKSVIDAGVTAILCAPGYPWWYDGIGFYDFKDGKKNYASGTQVRAQVRRLQDAGAKAIGGIAPMWEIEVLDKHPDWQWLTKPDSKPEMNLTKRQKSVGGCWYGPFGDWYIAKNVALAKGCGWDGQLLDGFGGTYTACYCDYCKKGYLKATGHGIPRLKTYPAPPDVSDPEYRHFIKWRMAEYDRFVAKWMAALKQVKPDYIFTPWSTGPGRWWHWTYAPLVEHSETVNRIVDAPMLELFWDFPANQANNLLPSFTNRYYRGITRENPAIMCIYFRTQGQQNAAPPQVESDFRIFTVMNNGCLPFLITYVQDGTTKPEHYLEQVKIRRKWTDGAKSVKWAAMLVSQNSRLFYGISGTHGTLKEGKIGSGVDTPDNSKVAPSQRRIPAHMESAVGTFRAALEDHLPLDIIVDADLEDEAFLAQYKVLVLPNAACLSDKACAAIRRFVANGGGLLATHESSLYDDFGDKRKDFALADLFGATYLNIADHSARWPFFDHPVNIKFYQHPVIDDPVLWGNHQIGLDNVDYIGLATHVKEITGAEVVARRLLPGEAAPFVLVSQHGKGKVVYLAADVGQSYFTNPYQYERKLLTNSMRWLASEKPSVQVTAPMCVQSTFYQQPFDGAQGGGKRTVVHLLNETNSTTDRALPDGNPPMREEVVPVARIKVLFRDADIKRVHLEPEGQDMPLNRTAEGTEVSVPELGLHSMVVAEN